MMTLYTIPSFGKQVLSELERCNSAGVAGAEDEEEEEEAGGAAASGDGFRGSIWEKLCSPIAVVSSQSMRGPESLRSFSFEDAAGSFSDSGGGGAAGAATKTSSAPPMPPPMPMPPSAPMLKRTSS
jgi:hypothetical protein